MILCFASVLLLIIETLKLYTAPAWFLKIRVLYNVFFTFCVSLMQFIKKNEYLWKK